MGLSLTQIVILLAIVLPNRLVPSRATVGRWVQQSAQQSRGILEVFDRACQRWVLVWCLDEIFFHREPILMGVEPLSLAWLTAQRGPDRRGESWWKVIEAWPNLEHVIAQGGRGLNRGQTGQCHSPSGSGARGRVACPDHHGARCLSHGARVGAGVPMVVEPVERQIEAAVKADAKLEQAKRRGQDPRGVRAIRVAPGEKPSGFLMKR